MNDPITLTPEEARVLWTALIRAWLPMVGHDQAKSALDKLAKIGGGYCCRDCTALGKHSSRLGGFLCDEHKEVENARWSSTHPNLELEYRKAVVD